jgi:putative PIN family toxin of toxin-antitoxin system
MLEWCHRWGHFVRIVLDTASLISALRSSRGAAAEVIRLVLVGRIVLLMDYKLASEYRDVALRPEHLAVMGASESDINGLLDALEAIAEPVLIRSKPRPLSPDPNDDMVLDLAINGRAEFLVTQNTRHFASAAKRFGIPVLLPAECLNIVRQRG